MEEKVSYSIQNINNEQIHYADYTNISSAEPYLFLVQEVGRHCDASVCVICGSLAPWPGLCVVGRARASAT